MAYRSQKEVVAGVDNLAGAALAKSRKAIRKDCEPLIEAIRKAKSPEGLKRSLSGSLVERMGTAGLAEALADVGTQAAMIGIVGATPSELRK